MYRRSWKSIQEIIQEAGGMVAGGVLSVQWFYNFAPMLWLDFLNANPGDVKSMWLIYKDFSRYMEDLREWMEDEGYDYSQEMKDMRMLSREEFIEQYPGKLQPDAEKLHSGMREVIDKEATDVIKDLGQYPGGGVTNAKVQEEHARAKESITKDIHIPPWKFTVTITNISAAAMSGKDSYRLYLDTPKADHPGFWLSIILGGMLSYYYGLGKTARRCAAPDCGRYFIPSPRSHDQRYHSPACQNRHYKRKRRSR